MLVLYIVIMLKHNHINDKKKKKMNKRRKNLENLKDVHVTREGILFPTLPYTGPDGSLLIDLSFS